MILAGASEQVTYLSAERVAAGPRLLAWIGTANDSIVAVQFALFVPVALALGRRLPATRNVRLATATGVAAMAVAVVLHVLLVTRVLPFAIQFPAVSAGLVVVYLWLLTISLLGHRTATLPRPVTRFGLLIGWSLAAGALVVAAEVAALAFAVAGLGRWVVAGGVLDRSAMDGDQTAFPEVVGLLVHGINGMIVVQALLGFSAGELPALGALHGITALLLFATAFLAARRAGAPPVAEVEQPIVVELAD